MGYGLVCEWANLRAAMSKKPQGKEEDTEKQPKKKEKKKTNTKPAKRRRQLEEKDEEEEGTYRLCPTDVARQVAEHLLVDHEQAEGRAGIDLVVSAGEASCSDGQVAVMIMQKGTQIPCPSSDDCQPIYFDIPPANPAVFEPLRAYGPPFDQAPRWFAQSIRY